LSSTNCQWDEIPFEKLPFGALFIYIKNTSLPFTTTSLATNMRPLLSYDDITDSQSLRPKISQNSSNQQHQSKKRKRNNGQNSHNNKKRQFGAAVTPHYTQHWDDPETSTEQVAYDDPDNTELLDDEKAEGSFEESRELTHDEIWDDSALIDAWDAATEEYEVCCYACSVFTPINIL
jgi:hypothetical protein